MDDRESILVRLPPKLKIDLERVAREHKRSVTREAELAIERHVTASPAPAHD